MGSEPPLQDPLYRAGNSKKTTKAQLFMRCVYFNSFFNHFIDLKIKFPTNLYNLASSRLLWFWVPRGVLGLYWTNQCSEVSADTWGTFRTLWSKKSKFLKGNFCIYKGFMDVFYILTSAWKKNHKISIRNWFFVMCLTCVNGSTIQFVLHELLFRIN